MTEIAPSTEQAAFAWTFGQAVFDEGRWELLVTGQAQALERKPLEVLAYLLSRHERDLGSLMALLDRLDDYALSEHRLVTVPLLKQMLASESPHP